MLDIILQRGAEPLKWLIVVGIAYTLAMTIWVFFATPIAPVYSTTARSTDTPQMNRPTGNVNWILNKNLFGRAGAETPSATVQEAAVQTRLPLDLQSVFVASDESRSTAIIAQRGKAGLLYRIGDTLPGNAELVAIDHDEVFLRRAGVRESLPFPRTKSSGVTATQNRERAPAVRTAPSQDRADAQSPEEATDPSATEATITDYQERFAEDAAGTLDDLGIEVAEGGGYRIGSLNQTPALRQTGLQSGDVVLSINGRAVGDLEQDQLELENILAQGSARIEVRRGERRFFITASLPGQP